MRTIITLTCIFFTLLGCLSINDNTSIEQNRLLCDPIEIKNDSLTFLYHKIDSIKFDKGINQCSKYSNIYSSLDSLYFYGTSNIDIISLLTKVNINSIFINSNIDDCFTDEVVLVYRKNSTLTVEDTSLIIDSILSKYNLKLTYLDTIIENYNLTLIDTSLIPIAKSNIGGSVFIQDSKIHFENVHLNGMTNFISNYYSELCSNSENLNYVVSFQIDIKKDIRQLNEELAYFGFRYTKTPTKNKIILITDK